MTVLETLYEQALAQGIAVERFSFPQTASAAVFINGKYYIGIDRSHFDTSAEEAECLAHELGHCQTGALYAIGATTRKKQEKRADEWAILRLIPKASFYKAIENGCREIWEFAEELGISYRFAEKVVAYYLKTT